MTRGQYLRLIGAATATELTFQAAMLPTGASAESAKGLSSRHLVASFATGENVVMSPFSLAAAVRAAALLRGRDAPGSLVFHDPSFMLSTAAWVPVGTLVPTAARRLLEVQYLDGSDPSEGLQRWIIARGISLALPFKPSPSTEIVLSAAHFQSAWQFRFSSSRSSRKTFHGRQPAQAMFMSQNVNAGVSRRPAHDSAELSLGSDYTFAIVLPHAEAHLTSDDLLRAFVERREPAKLELSIPRFGFTSVLDFTSDVRRLISSAESQRTFQVAQIAVDERGVDAQALTEVVMPLGELTVPSRSFTLTLDRPFFFAVLNPQREPVFFGCFASV